ncbi:MAG: alkaline phosphatase family protein, partial [Deltaproteobacteria bacterium]|nr:alkaline phosphatase family protein [Deltaproteobacteria bacterium]
RHKKHKRLTRRVVVLGLDGLSPDIVEPMMKAGKLPHFSQLKATGFYSPLTTTNPPISPVAWSSFQTGVNPGKHNVFDFLSRDPKTYFPTLSFSRVKKSNRSLTIGKYTLPLSKPRIQLLRRSKPFWHILGEYGIYSSVLRVPVTFPPEKFRGHLLSAMGTPDLKGSQGTFTYYTTRKHTAGEHTGGIRVTVEKKGRRIRSYIPGPENPFLKNAQEMRIPFVLDLIPESKEAKIKLNGTWHTLKQGVYSNWIRLSFKAFSGVRIHGIGRFLIRNMDPEFDMYLTPVNIDPEKPAMPVSHPLVYSVYLASALGKYATLGEAEDTWALNEQVIDENEFLQQCYLLFDERKGMFFQTLGKTKTGVCVCVFDTPDRIQHMFWRPTNQTNREEKNKNFYKNTVEDLYGKMDGLLRELVTHLNEKDILFVLSDHGIRSFRRCFNLNTWLQQNGYLHVKNPEKTEGDFFAHVDWEKTRAYGVGMAGLYINQEGREKYGTVETGRQKHALKKELQQTLTGLRDEEAGEIAILNVYDTDEIYAGPYRDNGPDLIIGCNNGYRISWDSVIGKHGDKVFEDNAKSWQADHSVDSRIVPGVLFSNKRLAVDNPGIMDLAPTILNLFGIEIPAYMDGKAIAVPGDAAAGTE